jgi:hypothetical protein
MAPKKRSSGRHPPGSRTRANGYQGESGWDRRTQSQVSADAEAWAVEEAAWAAEEAAQAAQKLAEQVPRNDYEPLGPLASAPGQCIP